MYVHHLFRIGIAFQLAIQTQGCPRSPLDKLGAATLLVNPLSAGCEEEPLE